MIYPVSLVVLLAYPCHDSSEILWGALIIFISRFCIALYAWGSLFDVLGSMVEAQCSMVEVQCSMVDAYGFMFDVPGSGFHLQCLVGL